MTGLACVLAAGGTRGQDAQEPAAPQEAAPGGNPVFTLEECIALGLEQAVAAINAQRDEQIAGKRIGQVRSQLLPQLSADGSYTRLDDVPAFDFGGEIVEMGREDNYAAGIEVSQLLYSGGSVGQALKAAKLYRGVAREELRQARNELVRDIRTGFNDILLADAQLDVQEASLAQLEDLLAQAEARQRQETASEMDVLAARVRVANERPLVIRARKEQALARAAFRNLVQIGPEAFDLDGDLVFEPSDRSLEDWQALAAERRPELRQLAGLLQMREAEILAERGGGRPQVRAFAAYDGTNPESGTAADEWDWGWSAGVTVEWDVFDGAGRSSRIAELQLELDKARDTLADTERQVALEVRTYYLDLQQAAETVAAGTESVELAEKSLEIAQTRYDNGLATYLDVTEANVALSRARVTRLLALHGHMNALARLRQASGEDYETGERE